MDKLYVTGHRNPDTDSICSAIAYADLKSRMYDGEVEPIKLGDISRETRFVLEYFDVEEPRLKESMKPQVRDLDMDKALIVDKEITLSKAMNLIQTNDAQILTITGEDGSLEGVATLTDIMETYTEIWDDQILHRAETSLNNILDVLSANIIHQPEKPRPIDGKITVYAMEPSSTAKLIGENDIVIVGDRKEAQADAIGKKVALIVLTGGFQMDEDILEKARKENITVLSTQNSTFMAARLLPLAAPISYVATMENIIAFDMDDYVENAEQIMTNTRYSAYPVIDRQNEIVGTISRYHLITNEKKKLILVDHNERNQSIEDIDEAEIVEIIDHHRVANIATTNPVYFRNEPVGSTATIVAKMYFESGLMPSKKIAGILASAIISDTLLLTSPTATPDDKRILDRLSKIAGINTEDFADEMFKAGTSLEGKSANDLLNSDVKTFLVEGKKIRVAQIFTMDMDSIKDIKADLLKEMEEIRTSQGEDTFVVMLTDILKTYSQVLVKGSYSDSLADTFDTKIEDSSFISDGLVSRKKQLIPKLNRAVSQENS